MGLQSSVIVCVCVCVCVCVYVCVCVCACVHTLSDVLCPRCYQIFV